jgi:hypothetical protein|eukprot:COSAG01_NODE_8567_length_2737_cov_9.320697_3_plen_164_part_00
MGEGHPTVAEQRQQQKYVGCVARGRRRYDVAIIIITFALRRRLRRHRHHLPGHRLPVLPRRFCFTRVPRCPFNSRAHAGIHAVSAPALHTATCAATQPGVLPTRGRRAGVMAVLVAQTCMFAWVHQDPSLRLQRRSWFEVVSYSIMVRWQTASLPSLAPTWLA